MGSKMHNKLVQQARRIVRIGRKGRNSPMRAAHVDGMRRKLLRQIERVDRNATQR